MNITYGKEKMTLYTPVSPAYAAKLIGAKSAEDIEIEYTSNEALKLRQDAYKAESDGLFLAYQFDATDESKQCWMNKVLEIKARYPKTNA